MGQHKYNDGGLNYITGFAAYLERVPLNFMPSGDSLAEVDMMENGTVTFAFDDNLPRVFHNENDDPWWWLGAADHPPERSLPLPSSRSGLTRREPLSLGFCSPARRRQNASNLKS